MTVTKASKWSRESKKLATMRRVQAAALDLFEQYGFGGVTIEQVADAAEVSAPTVYRHFGTKERLVLWDEYDPLIFSTLVEHPPGETLLDSLASALVRAVDAVYAIDARRIFRRARLMRQVPALRAANASASSEMRDGLAAWLLSARACENELAAQVIAGAVVASLEVAVLEWEKAGGLDPLGPILNQALRQLAQLTCVDRRSTEPKAAKTRKKAELPKITKLRKKAELPKITELTRGARGRATP